MIYGIGCDIVQVSRFAKIIEKNSFINRFFNKEETLSTMTNVQHAAEHYASRFAAKEAFSKALGTGIIGFELKEIFIVNKESGQPELKVTGKALDLLKSRCGMEARVFVSLSHEKEYAMAYVVIEK